MVFLITGDLASGKSTLTGLMGIPWNVVIEGADGSVEHLIRLDLLLEWGYEMVAVEATRPHTKYIAAIRKVSEDRGASFRHIHITK